MSRQDRGEQISHGTEFILKLLPSSMKIDALCFQRRLGAKVKPDVCDVKEWQTRSKFLMYLDWTTVYRQAGARCFQEIELCSPCLRTAHR